MKTVKLVECCSKMKKEFFKNNIISSNANFKDSDLDDDFAPRILIQSDAGMGGSEEIDFCPFCGKKIEILIVSTSKKKF